MLSLVFFIRKLIPHMFFKIKKVKIQVIKIRKNEMLTVNHFKQ